MSDYSRQNDFTAKDALTTGDPNKLIKGSEVDAEFDALVTAVATKVDEPSSPTSGDVLEWTGSAVGWASRNIASKINGVAPSCNLYVRNGSTATTQLRATADELMVFTTGNSGLLLSSVDVTATISASGANGLDTGSEASATWYHLWVIYNGSSTDALLSVSTTAPSLPGGYTHRGYVGAVYNDSSSDFQEVAQRGNLAVAESTANVYTSAAHTTLTSFDISAFIPPNAVAAVFTVSNRSSDNGATSTGLAPTNSAALTISVHANSGDSTVDRTLIEFPIAETQTIYSILTGTGIEGSLTVSGWRF